METKIAVTCECQPRKIALLDELVLKDGTTGIVCEFDRSPLGYDICIRSSIGSGETVRRWIHRDEIAELEHEVIIRNGECSHQCSSRCRHEGCNCLCGEWHEYTEGDRTAADYADANPVSDNR